MRDNSMGCATMQCPIYGVNRAGGYWCCFGCDEKNCESRCYNNRVACGCATKSNQCETSGRLPKNAAQKRPKIYFKQNQEQKVNAYILWKSGEMNKTQAAKACGISYGVLDYFIKKQEAL